MPGPVHCAQEKEKIYEAQFNQEGPASFTNLLVHLLSQSIFEMGRLHGGNKEKSENRYTRNGAMTKAVI